MTTPRSTAASRPRRRGAASRPKYLYLTTTGRVTGQPHEIEIWFVEAEGRFYVLSGDPQRANWVKNIRRDGRVRVRLGDREIAATARVLDAERDAESWRLARGLSEQKYGWGDGMPVEIAPS